MTTPHTPAELAALLYTWERTHATPEQQAAAAESSEPYNYILAASPYGPAYDKFSTAEQLNFWECVDNLYVN